MSNSVAQRQNARNGLLDVLRLLSIVLVVLAHVSPPGWLFQLRNFDVPLLILVSAYVVGMPGGRAPEYGNGLIKRIERLIIPVWLFLFIFFSLFFILGKISGSIYPYLPKTILSTFLLLDGIGYVWIIRINILMALLAPCLYVIEKKSGKWLWLLLPAVLMCFELAFRAAAGVENFVFAPLFKYVIFAAIPYALVYMVGLRLPKMENVALLWLSFGSLGVFLFLAFLLKANGMDVSTQHYKYPAQTYYLAYAIAIASALFYLGRRFLLEDKLPLVVIRLGGYSMWIYLWHILVLTLLQRYMPNLHWFVMFVFVFSGAVAATLLMRAAATKVLSMVRNPRVAYYLEIAFLK
ncbi:MAG: acyltransferase [Chitinivorax sp.]